MPLPNSTGLGALKDNWDYTAEHFLPKTIEPAPLDMAHAQAASEDQPTPHPKSVSSSTAIYRALTQASNQEDTDQKDESVVDKAEKTIQKIDSITHQPLSITPQKSQNFWGELFQDDSAENDGQTQESSLSSSDQILGKIAEQENESGHRSKWEEFWDDPLTQDAVTIASMIPIGRVATTALRVGEEAAPSIAGKLLHFFKPDEDITPGVNADETAVLQLTIQ